MPAQEAARWGFHWLDSREATRLVARAGVGPGDLVLDVGAGQGAITAALVAAGAQVWAVERHPARARLLRERFAGVAGVRVVQADAADLHLPRRSFRVVANPPGAVTSALLRRLLAPASRLRSALLLLPVPVAPGGPDAGRSVGTSASPATCPGRPSTRRRRRRSPCWWSGAACERRNRVPPSPASEHASRRKGHGPGEKARRRPDHLAPALRWFCRPLGTA